jgi:bacteriorhodopsin
MDPILFTGFCILFLSTCAFYFMSGSMVEEKRLFHIICMSVCGIASTAYAVMAFGGGSQELTLADGTTRPFFYIRYIDWLLTTPLLLLDIGLLAGAKMTSILFIIAMDVLMILCGVVGPSFFAGDNLAKWLLFTLGCVYFLPILKALGSDWAASAKPAVKGIYASTAYPTLVLWLAYPFMWALCEGTNVVSPGTEVLLYTILDVCAKAGVSFVLLSNHGVLEEATAGFQQLN